MTTDQQVRLLMSLIKKGFPLATAAVKAGMSEGTARKYRRLGKPPSEVGAPHGWRTRSDPFEAVWAEAEAAARAGQRASGEDRVRGAATPPPGTVPSRSAAHPAAPISALAGAARRGQGGVLRTSAPSRGAVPVGLHRDGCAGGDDCRRRVPAPALSLRADVLELGVGVAVLQRDVRGAE